MTTIKPLDDLMKIFLSEDDMMPALMQPNTVGDFTYATDAHALLIIPNKNLEKVYPRHEKTPSYDGVMPKEYLPESLIIKDTQIFAVLAKCKKVSATSNCNECEGKGYVECNLGHEHECIYCAGEGYFPDSSKEKVYPDTEFIKIGYSYFSAFQIGRLEKFLLETEMPLVMLTSAVPFKGHMFDFGVARLLIMPVLSNGSKEVEKAHILI